MSFGPWMLKVFAVLAKFKFLRGTAFDPFGYTAERQMERRLVSEYEQLLDEIFEHLTPSNHHVAVALAMIPEKIRGFGPVKQRHLAAAKGGRSSVAGAIPRRRDDPSQGCGVAQPPLYNQFTCDLILDRLPAVFSYRDNKIVHKRRRGVKSRARERGRTGGLGCGAKCRRWRGYVSQAADP